jgi:hypothetical protein
MMSATVSVWVPLAVAGVGLVSTFGAWFLTRWADRRDRREQWQHDDSLRWQQDRQHAYAGLMAALDEWDREFSSVVATFKVDARLNTSTEVDAGALTRLGRAANEAAALVRLMAPEVVSELAESTIKDRRQFRTSLALRIVGAKLDNPSDFTELDARWDQLLKKTDRLREAMRDDLGIESRTRGAVQRKGELPRRARPGSPLRLVHRGDLYAPALGFLPDEPRAISSAICQRDPRLPRSPLVSVPVSPRAITWI